GSRQPTEPQHTSTTALPSHVEPIPIVASSSQPKKTQKYKKTKRKAIEISQSSRPTTLVSDATIHEERGDNVERAVATATSLDAEQGSGVNTLGSDEERIELKELMDMCTKLSDMCTVLLLVLSVAMHKPAQRLQAELDEEARFERERKEEASKAANIVEWDDVQAMMDADMS
ncbi:hypothetical protein Tco_1330742, partial [Tanacetum coccineum]